MSPTPFAFAHLSPVTSVELLTNPNNDDRNFIVPTLIVSKHNNWANGGGGGKRIEVEQEDHGPCHDNDDDASSIEATQSLEFSDDEDEDEDELVDEEDDDSLHEGDLYFTSPCYTPTEDDHSGSHRSSCCAMQQNDDDDDDGKNKKNKNHHHHHDNIDWDGLKASLYEKPTSPYKWTNGQQQQQQQQIQQQQQHRRSNSADYYYNNYYSRHHHDHQHNFTVGGYPADGIGGLGVGVGVSGSTNRRRSFSTSELSHESRYYCLHRSSPLDRNGATAFHTNANGPPPPAPPPPPPLPKMRSHKDDEELRRYRREVLESEDKNVWAHAYLNMAMVYLRLHDLYQAEQFLVNAFRTFELLRGAANHRGNFNGNSNGNNNNSSHDDDDGGGGGHRHEDDDGIASCCFQFGILYRLSNDYERSIAAFEDCRLLRERSLSDSSSSSSCFASSRRHNNTDVNVQVDDGDDDDDHHHHDDHRRYHLLLMVLAELKRTHDEYGNVREMRRYDRASESIRRSIRIRVLNARGDRYRYEGQYENAISSHMEASRILKSALDDCRHNRDDEKTNDVDDDDDDEASSVLLLHDLAKTWKKLAACFLQSTSVLTDDNLRPGSHEARAQRDHEMVVLKATVKYARGAVNSFTNAQTRRRRQQRRWGALRRKDGRGGGGGPHMNDNPDDDDDDENHPFLRQVRSLIQRAERRYEELRSSSSSCCCC